MRYPVTTLPRTRTVTVPARSDVDHHHLDARIRAHLGPAGNCPDGDGRSTHVLLFDDSASVVGYGGTDPAGRRYQETTIAVDLLGHSCRCGRELVGVVHFDVGQADVAPTAVATRPGLAAVHEALRVPGNGAGVSTVGPALAVAAGFPGPLTTLVILSDFALTDTDAVTDLLATRQTWVDHVHVVSLGLVPSFTGDVVPPWVTVTRLGHRPGQVAEAVHRSFTRSRLPSRRTS
jgi:hypothetical protein